MKKCVLFLALVLAPIGVFAQFEVGSWDFSEDGAAEGWLLIDNDESGTTWILENNDCNNLMGDGEAFDVLKVPNTELTGVNFRSNWAILPVQDMSIYSGVKLNFSYLKGLFACEKTDNLKIYAGINANVADMLANGAIATVTLEGDDSIFPPEAVLKTVDIPMEWNSGTLYFAIAQIHNPGDPTSNNWNIELTKVSITAEELSVNDFSWKTSTIVTQNPVDENLQLGLGSQLEVKNTNIRIYNAVGILVNESAYAADIRVNTLSAGIYFAVISDGTITERLKFIKK